MERKSRKKLLHKRMGASMIIVGVISVVILLFFARFYWIGPKCTTNYFHFNIDYRLGDKEVEDTIIREPYYKLLQMYEKHPNWAFTVECQAEMIEKIYTKSKYKEIADLTTDLVESGQMELICGLQFSQLFYMYPSDVLELNLQYANQTLKEHGLLKERSNCLLFQEGQFGYGLATLLNSPYAGNIDTVLVSAQQILDFRDYGYRGENFPVYELKNTETGKKINMLEYNYLPQWEAGYLHSWNFLLDAELGFEDSDSEEEFVVDDDKILAYEQELMMLELEGNQFFTCSQWVEHCKDVGAYRKLDYYIPECNWGTTKYNSSYIWAANNGDSTDDGEMLASNYRVRQVISATREVYNQNIGSISAGNKTIIENKFTNAEKLWLQATVTDATGIGPDWYERVTAEQNQRKAMENCSQILEIIAEEVPQLNVSKIQVDLLTNMVYNNTNDFISLINVTSYNLDDKVLPFEFDLSYAGDGDPLVNISSVSYNSSDANNDALDMYRFDVYFEGSHDWNDDSIYKIGIKLWFEDDDDDEKNFGEIIYSPSLLEEYTKRIYRSDYQYDPVYIFMPLSNGLLFIPDKYTGFEGIAIVKNVTTRHTSWLWDYWSIEILETEGLHMDAHHQFYIIEDISLERALNFANRINVSPPWTISQNASYIQGYGVFDMYLTIDNRIGTDDQGSGEWW